MKSQNEFPYSPRVELNRDMLVFESAYMLWQHSMHGGNDGWIVPAGTIVTIVEFLGRKGFNGTTIRLQNGQFAVTRFDAKLDHPRKV